MPETLICAQCGHEALENEAFTLYMPCPRCGSARVVPLASMIPLVVSQHGENWREICFPKPERMLGKMTVPEVRELVKRLQCWLNGGPF